MSFNEKLLEGKYLYWKDEVQYSEENFKVFVEDKRHGNFTFSSEILSRVSTGEFLKVYVDYEVTHKFDPLNIRVRRSLGKRNSTERFVVDPQQKLVTYYFDSDESEEEFEKVINGKFQIATPSFLTSMIMTQSKKIDPVHRTPYTILTTSNIWKYEQQFTENEVYVELLSLDTVEIEVAGNKLSASPCKLFEGALATANVDSGTSFYLSKYFNIPYKADFKEGVTIVVDKLKNFESKYKGMF